MKDMTVKQLYWMIKGNHKMKGIFGGFVMNGGGNVVNVNINSFTGAQMVGFKVEI